VSDQFFHSAEFPARGEVSIPETYSPTVGMSNVTHANKNILINLSAEASSVDLQFFSIEPATPLRVTLKRGDAVLFDDAVKAAAATKADTVAAANAAILPSGQTVGEAVEELAIKIGEKLEVSAAAYFDGQTAVYLHRRASDLPPQVGVLVEYEGSDPSAARSVAMQIAAMRPQYVSRDEVPRELVDNERRIAEATAKEEGKPEQALPKIIEGRLNAYFKDVALLDQPSVIDNKVPVGRQLDEAGIKVLRFVRFEAAGT